jgi:hypothetical protein
MQKLRLEAQESLMNSAACFELSRIKLSAAECMKKPRSNLLRNPRTRIAE